MKARLETGVAGRRELGIVVESEAGEEARRLIDLWCAKGRCCVFERINEQIRLTIAPTEVEQ